MYWVVDNRLASAIKYLKKIWSRDMTSQSRDDVIITGYGNLCAFNINLIMLYDSQKAKKCAQRYVYVPRTFFISCQNNLTPGTPRKPPKTP